MFDPDFLYLLFIDIVKLPGRTIHDFEAAEPGYTSAIIEGYQTAFAQPLRGGGGAYARIHLPNSCKGSAAYTGPS